MKAKPLKQVAAGEWHSCKPSEATHLRLTMPGPSMHIMLPVMIKGRREGTDCWTWNGDVEKPTLRPSVLTRGTTLPKEGEDPADKTNWKPFVCHSWVTDGKAQFLDDCSHELRSQTVDLLDVD